MAGAASEGRLEKVGIESKVFEDAGAKIHEGIPELSQGTPWNSCIPGAKNFTKHWRDGGTRAFRWFFRIFHGLDAEFSALEDCSPVGQLVPHGTPFHQILRTAFRWLQNPSKSQRQESAHISSQSYFHHDISKDITFIVKTPQVPQLPSPLPGLKKR